MRLLKGEEESASDAVGVQNRVSAQTEAGLSFIEGLQEWPDDERLAVGFDAALQAVKLIQGDTRWSAWPFGGPGEAAEAIHWTVDYFGSGKDLSKCYFVLIGAGSAMGPFSKLLAHGANVVALDIPGSWGKVSRSID